MDESRLTLLPDQTLGPLLPALQGRLLSVGRSINARNFRSILDMAMRQLFDGVVDQVDATEGSIWLLEQQNLTIAYNTNPKSQHLVGKFKQPLSSGLLSMVFSNEQSFIENEVFRNIQQDKTLDSMLQVRTYAMIAVPFYFLQECRGVASCVQLISNATPEAASPNGFDGVHEAMFRNGSMVLGRLIDYWVVTRAIGLE